jgi:hypothetical protein
MARGAASAQPKSACHVTTWVLSSTTRHWNNLARARRLASHDELAHTRAHIVALRSAQRSGLATAKASGTSWRALDGWLGMTSSPAHAQRDAAIGAAALQQRGLEELADAL